MKILTVIVAVCFLPGSARAQPSPGGNEKPVQFTWTLQDVKKLAVEQNPDIKSAIANYNAASKSVMEAEGGMLPKVDITSGLQETTLPSPGAGSTANLGKELSYSSVVAGVSQLVYDFGKTLNDIAVNRALGNAVEQQAEAVRLAVSLSAELAFYSASSAEGLVAVARQGVAKFEETRRRISAMVEAKARPSFDLSQADVELSKARLNLIRAENDRELARIFLLKILGMPSETSFNLAGNSSARLVDPGEIDLRKLTETALQNRPELKRREYELESARSALLREKDGMYPVISAGGWIGKYYGYYPNALDNAWGAGLSMTWNIFEGRKTTARIGEFSAKVDAGSAELDKQRLTIESEVARGALDLKRQFVTLKVARENLDNAGENARLAKLRYDAGVATFLELLTADTALLEAQAFSVQTRYQYESALAFLATAVNGPID